MWWRGRDGRISPSWGPRRRGRVWRRYGEGHGGGFDLGDGEGRREELQDHAPHDHGRRPGRDGEGRWKRVRAAEVTTSALMRQQRPRRIEGKTSLTPRVVVGAARHDRWVCGLPIQWLGADR